MGEIWIYFFTVVSAAEPLALSSALRPFMSKENMRKKTKFFLILPPSLPPSLLPDPVKGQLSPESRALSRGRLQFHEQDRAHEKATIKPSHLQPLHPFQSTIFLLQRIWREGRSFQSLKLVLKSKAG